MRALASTLEANRTALVQTCGQGLSAIPGYARLPESSLIEAAQRALDVISACLKTGDDAPLIKFLEARLAERIPAGFAFDDLQQAVGVFEAALLPLIAEVETAKFVWLALSKGRALISREAAQAERAQAEQTLQRSARLVQTVMDSIPQQIFWKDRDSIFLGCNKNFAVAAGLTNPAQIVGKSDYDLRWTRQQADEFRAIDQQVMRDDAAQHRLVEPRVQADGSVAWMETNKIPLHDADGQVIGVLGTFDDVTERVRADESRRQVEEQLRLQSAALQAAANAIVITDHTGRVIWVNSAYTALTGYSTDEVLNRNPRILKSGQHDAAFYRNLWDTILAGQVWRGEIVNRRKDGSLYTEEMTITPVRDTRGDITHFIAVKQDITERKQAEQALAEREELYRRAIAAADAVPYLRQYGQTAYPFMGESIVKLTGYTAHEMTTELLNSLIQETHLTGELESLSPQEAIRQTQTGELNVWNSELRIRTRAGETRWLGDSAIQVREADGKLASAVGILQDITQRKQVEQELARRAEQLATLNRVGLAIASALDMGQVLGALYEQCRQVVPTDTFYVALYDAPSGQIRFPLFMDHGQPVTMNAHDIHVRPGLSGRIIQSRQTLYIPDTLDPQAMAAFQIIRSGGEPTRSYVGVPIILRDQVMGAISTQSYQPNAYTAEQVRLLETIATQAAVALENARLYEIAQQELAERTQAELALRDSRQLLQTVMDNIPQAVFWKDRNLVYLGCNRAFAADAGLASAQDIFGKTDWDMPWKEQAELYRADDTRVMDSGAPKLDYEEPQTTPDGSIIWLRTNKVPLRDADGNVTAVLGMYEDITDRKRLVQQIQEALERRGRQVQTSTEVAQEIAAAPALDELFNRVVTLVKERFGYYHAQILRYDPAQDAVVLVAGYGAAGRTMLAAGHKVVMGRGVVGTAAASGASVLASDVLQDQDWRPNPNLPDTQGELAVPIKLRDQVLGILDVQSDRVNALTLDDQLLLEGLCGQIAIAIQNTQLLQQTRHRVQVEALVSNISTSFVNVAVERVSDEINATLRKLGESNDIDRAYIFQFTPDGATMDNTHEWCAPGVSPYIDSLQHIPIDTFPMLLERIRQLDVFHAPRVADLPAASTERTEFEKEGIQSIICVPIVTRGTAIGFIGFDSVRQAKAWADEDILLLRLVGEIVAASLERRRTEEQQQETLRELERLYRATTREGWQTFRQTANLPAGYVFDRGALQPNEDVWFPEIEQALESNTLIEPSTPGAPTVAPLTVYGQVIGALGVMNDPRQRLTPDDTALIASVSEQVAQALESARLFEQTQSARQQAEASLRNVQVLQRLTGQISATLDMERVVDTLLQTLATELSFSYLAFNLIDDEARMMRTLRATGLAANLNGLVRPLDALQNDILMDVARRGQIEIIDGWDPRFDRELFEKSGHAELVRAYVPLVVREQAVGVLEVGYRRGERPAISPEEIALLDSLADQVAVALQNTRLYRQTQARARREQILREATARLRSSTDPDAVMRTLARELGTVLERPAFVQLARVAAGAEGDTAPAANGDGREAAASIEGGK